MNENKTVSVLFIYTRSVRLRRVQGAELIRVSWHYIHGDIITTNDDFEGNLTQMMSPWSVKSVNALGIGTLHVALFPC